MADRATLLALAERCEAATGPDRDLDLCIGWEMDGEGYSEADLQYATANLHAAHVTPFTSSLDAALTLVPEGHSWGAGDLDEDGHPWACVTADDEPCPDYSGSAATAELALCAASLRAIAAQAEGGA